MTNDTIDGFDDIHTNMRFWVSSLLRAVEADLGAPRTAVLYDIGSNDGELSLPLLSGERGARRRVIAFEPQSAPRKRLMLRAAEQGNSAAVWETAELTVVPLALGEDDREITMELYSDDTFSSFFPRPSDERKRYHLDVTNHERVRVRPLDDLVRERRVAAPDLVKIDVEGAERAVLHGAIRTLALYRPPVIVEYSVPNTANAGYQRGEIIERLRRAGYDTFGGLFRNRDRTLYGEEAFADPRIWNVVAVCRDACAGVTSLVQRSFGAWPNGE